MIILNISTERLVDVLSDHDAGSHLYRERDTEGMFLYICNSQLSQQEI